MLRELNILHDAIKFGKYVDLLATYWMSMALCISQMWTQAKRVSWKFITAFISTNNSNKNENINNLIDGHGMYQLF
jgi:hypothetical protein